jgi:hypothetical protein
MDMSHDVSEWRPMKPGMSDVSGLRPSVRNCRGAKARWANFDGGPMIGDVVRHLERGCSRGC